MTYTNPNSTTNIAYVDSTIDTKFPRCAPHNAILQHMVLYYFNINFMSSPKFIIKQKRDLQPMPF